MSKNVSLADQRGIPACEQYQFKRVMSGILAKVKDDPELMAKIRARVAENRKKVKA